MQKQALRTFDSEIGLQKLHCFIHELGRLTEDLVPGFGLEKYQGIDSSVDSISKFEITNTFDRVNVLAKS